MTPKYQPLETFLATRQSEEVPATFEEIERIIGAKLPNVAHTHRAWWSNNPSNNVMTKSWLAAGYKTERVDMAAGRLVFRRARDRNAPGGSPTAKTAHTPTAKSVLERLWDALADSVHVQEGVDLTQPTGEAWDAERR
jgi:hypothetical protein